MNRLYFQFLLLAVLNFSCTSSETNKRIDQLSIRIDSLEKNPFGIDKFPDDKTYKFDWFDLGKPGHQILDRLFYVANVQTSFRDNGYSIKVTVANITTISITNAIVECAIKDTTTRERVVSGYSTAPTLYPGEKVTFDVFVPTTKTNVTEIGVLIRNYRM